jgi:hypothetical protein
LFTYAVGLLTVIGLVSGGAAPAGAASDRTGSFSGFTLVGAATLPKPTKLLVTNATGFGAAGAAWLTEKQNVGDGFTAKFKFAFTEPTSGGADGVTFTVQNSAVDALGGEGGYLGYNGIPDSLTVEFDSWLNDWVGISDPDANHVSVHTMGTDPNSADESASIGITSAIPDMSDGVKHSVKITYVPNKLTVALDGVKILKVKVNLATKLALSDGMAWVGFTSGTGIASENHWVYSFSMA